MKKLLLLLSFATILSCSSSDENSSSNSKFYNPPAWIQGTWGQKASEGMSEQGVYKFETDNVCQLTGVTSLCWKEMASQYKNANTPNLVAEDTQTSSTYEAKFGVMGQTITLKFERISATQIKWVNTGSAFGDIVYDKLN